MPMPSPGVPEAAGRQSPSRPSPPTCLTQTTTTDAAAEKRIGIHGIIDSNTAKIINKTNMSKSPSNMLNPRTPAVWDENLTTLPAHGPGLPRRGDLASQRHVPEVARD